MLQLLSVTGKKLLKCTYVAMYHQKDSNYMVAFNYLIVVWDIFTCRHKF